MLDYNKLEHYFKCQDYVESYLAISIGVVG